MTVAAGVVLPRKAGHSDDVLALRNPAQCIGWSKRITYELLSCKGVSYSSGPASRRIRLTLSVYVGWLAIDP